MNKFVALLFVLMLGTVHGVCAKEVQVKGYTTKTGKEVKGYTRTVKDKVEPDTVEVKGYTRKDGTKVKGYTRKKAK